MMAMGAVLGVRARGGAAPEPPLGSLRAPQTAQVFSQEAGGAPQARLRRARALPLPLPGLNSARVREALASRQGAPGGWPPDTRITQGHPRA